MNNVSLSKLNTTEKQDKTQMPDLTKFLDLTLKRKNTDENLNIEEEIHKSSRRIIATLNPDDRAILNNYVSLVSEIFDDCALVLYIIENDDLSSKFDQIKINYAWYLVDNKLLDSSNNLETFLQLLKNATFYCNDLYSLNLEIDLYTSFLYNLVPILEHTSLYSRLTIVNALKQKY